MTINDAVLQSNEKVIFSLRELYLKYGYHPYRMSKFEEYDVYAENKDFLVSDQVITFTDTNGKLMALKPDVTLSVIKNTEDLPLKTRKIFYNENVYRVSKGTGSFKEIMQTGVECFGNVGTSEICEVLSLAAESLHQLSDRALIAVSSLDLISGLINRMQLAAEQRRALYQAIGEKNLPQVDKLCTSSADNAAAELLKQLLSLHGTVNELLPILERLPFGKDDSFVDILRRLAESRFSALFYLDFSVISDINYYNGVVFKGFLRDVPTAVLSGGQYDRLMRRMGKQSHAIGFAVYTDLLDRIDLSDSENAKRTDAYLNIALPKGRLGEKIYEMFANAGFECPSILENNRKLIFENPEKGVRYFWVKPSDVSIYVEHGAADIGVAGKDILEEYEPDVYELLDLKKGKCRMAVAAPAAFTDDSTKTLRVATKFANIAKNYYRSVGRNIDIIHLNGSIEIAPILGLSDVIVDIVETGTTLKENDLMVFEEILPISARLIANKSAYKFKFDQIRGIVDGFSRMMEDEND